MKMVAFGAMALAIAAGTATAQLPFVTGFEAPAYAPGPLAGQNTWTEINGNTGAPTTNMTVVNNAANAFAGSQYVSTTPGAWGAFTNNTARYAWVDNPDASPSIDMSLRVWVSSGGSMTIGGGMFSFGTDTAPGDTLIGGMRLLNNGALQLFNGAGQGIGFTAVPALLNSWNEMRMISYHTGGNYVDFYFNGQYLNPLLGTFSTAFAPCTFNDADLYAVRGTSGTSTAEIRYDNMSVTVPTPGALALLGLGGLVAGRRRR